MMGEAAPGFRWRFERCGAATESIAAEAGVVLSIFIQRGTEPRAAKNFARDDVVRTNAIRSDQLFE